MKCFDYIKSDLFRYEGKYGFKAFFKQYFLIGEGFRFCFWLRICHFSKKNRIAKFFVFPWAYLMYRHYRYKYGYDISYNTPIGPGLLIFHINGIIFRPEYAGKNVTISQGTTVGMKIVDGKKRFPVIGDNVYIAPGAAIVGGVTIGNNVAVGTNSVLLNSLEDNAVAVGIPAKIVSHNGAFEYVNNPI